MNAVPPPGWYPVEDGGLRYWDGTRWTEHTAPGSPAASVTPNAAAGAKSRPDSTAPATSSPSSGNWFVRHKVLSGVLAVVLLGGIAGAFGDDGADEPSPGASSSAAEDGTVDESDGSDEEVEVEDVVEAEPVDTDGDGVVDDEDYDPKDPKVRTQDDVDTDEDGVADYKDAFPKDPKYSKDSDDDGVADALDAFPTNAKYSRDTDGDRVADAVDAFPRDPGRSKITFAMENALESAKSYLDYTAFSRLGLIDQLSSRYGEGFALADATWAVDQLDVDWNQQAVLSAKSYLEYTSFSRQGLIDQLSSAYGEQFTVAQATYAADKVGY